MFDGGFHVVAFGMLCAAVAASSRAKTLRCSRGHSRLSMCLIVGCASTPMPAAERERREASLTMMQTSDGNEGQGKKKIQELKLPESTTWRVRYWFYSCHTCQVSIVGLRVHPCNAKFTVEANDRIVGMRCPDACKCLSLEVRGFILPKLGRKQQAQGASRGSCGMLGDVAEPNFPFVSKLGYGVS